MTAQVKQGRVLSIDASRGTAMLFVCASHFADTYLSVCGAPKLYSVVKAITIISTPTFVFLSGMMLGFLHERNRAKFDFTTAKLVDRGLFLLFVVHFILVAANIVFWGGFTTAARIVFVTDMLGVSFVVAPSLVVRFSDARRAVFGICLFCASTVIAVEFRAETLAWRLASEILVGGRFEPCPRVLAYTFPLLPWFGGYLAATAIGGFIARSIQAGKLQQAARRLFTYGLVGVILAFAFRFILRRIIGSSALIQGTNWHELTSTFSKIPPSPAFLAFNAGIGLVLVACLMYLEAHKRLLWLLQPLSLMGQASLFAFVAQYFVYYLVLYSMKLPFTPLWPLILAISVTAIWVPSVLWAKRGYNRLFTVGYGRRRIARSPTASDPQPSVDFSG